MPTLSFTCPFCKAASHEYSELQAEAARCAVSHSCPGVQKRSYVFTDSHTAQGIPIYLRCEPEAVAAEA